MPVRVRTIAVAVVAVALLVTAAVLWASGGPVSYGWFAYAPLGDAPTSPEFALLTPRMQASLGLAAIALVLLAGLAGFWLGRRRRGTSEV